MSAAFDPYYTWLGIPPEEQPPSHYRLLGIGALEDNRDVITHAMDQRMAHLRTLQSGRHAEDSQKLLNEVSAAAVVLLDPAKKEEYDRTLKQQLAAAAAHPAPPVPQPPPVPPPALHAPPTAAGKQAAITVPLLAVGAIAGTMAVLLLGLLALAVIRSWSAPDRVATRVGAAAAGSDSSSSAPAAEHQPEQAPGETTNPAASAPGISSQLPVPLAPPPSTETTGSEPPVTTDPVAPPAATTSAPTAQPPPDAPPPSAVPSPISEPTVAEPSEPSSALPTPAEIEAARAKVLAIYGEEAKQASAPEQKRALADKLVQVAGDTGSDPAVKFVLLDAARKLYVGAGEIDQTLSTVSALSDEFDEDLRPLQIASLAAMADLPLPADRRDQLASALLGLINQAVADEDFVAADELARLAVRVSARTSDLPLRRAIVQKRSDLTRLKDEFHIVQQARQKLAADPGDQAANLVIGKFLCFVVADFEQGVPYLAVSDKQPFLAAAEADQSAVSGLPEHVLQAGDAWFALAESFRTSDKAVAAAALVRARHWYEKVLPLLSGLDKARVEKRMQSIGLVSGSLPTPPDAAKASAKAKGKKGKRKNKGSEKPIVE